MCGICGIALTERSRRRLDEQLLVRMRETMTHRGPDDSGIFLSGRVGIGQRRLSIIDLAGGHQPMSNDAGSIHITYNGEVYNHLELRSWLEQRGHRYRTRCDAETVLRLYEALGTDSVKRLRGMFAFGIWDAERRELVVVRDRLGIKPLYYAHTQDGSLYFASEIKALLEAGAVRPELCYPALGDFLANHAPSGGATLFKGIRRLPAGHLLTWREGMLHQRRYWDVDMSVRMEDGRGERDMLEGFRARFRESVRLRLMSDVPLGVFLSGGVDSSSIAAIMSQLVREPIKTFSVAFADREANELAYARMVARAYGTEHHEVLVSPEAFFSALPKLIWHEDEPLAHPSSIPLHYLAKLASEHVKVVLSGEGSDELLAGYSRYWKTRLNSRPGWQLRAARSKSG